MRREHGLNSAPKDVQRRHMECVFLKEGVEQSGAQQGVLLPQRYVQARGQMEQEPPAWLQPPSFHDAEPFGGIFGVGSQVELAHAAPRPPIP